MLKKMWCYSLLLLLAGCLGLSKKEIDARAKVFSLPGKEEGSYAIYVINPHGYYEPWAHYDIDLDGTEKRIHFGRYQQFPFKAKKAFDIGYRYDDGYRKKDEPNPVAWQKKRFTLTDFDKERNLFIFLDDRELHTIDKVEAIRKMVNIDGINEQLNRK